MASVAKKSRNKKKKKALAAEQKLPPNIQNGIDLLNDYTIKWNELTADELDTKHLTTNGLKVPARCHVMYKSLRVLTDANCTPISRNQEIAKLIASTPVDPSAKPLAELMNMIDDEKHAKKELHTQQQQHVTVTADNLVTVSGGLRDVVGGATSVSIDREEQVAATGSTLSATAVAHQVTPYSSERSFVPPGQHSVAAVGAIVEERLPMFVRLCHTGVPEDHLDGAQGLRKLLSIETNPPIDEIISSGVTPRFLGFLDSSDPRLVYEAACIFTKISSMHTRHLEALGAIPRFIVLLSHPSNEVAEQAVWALGNIAGDSTYFRDLVLRLGALQPVLKLCTESQKLTTLRNVTWTLSNFCRGKPAPEFETVSQCLPTMARLIYSAEDEIIADALLVLSYLSDGDNHRIQAVIDSGVVRRVVELLSHPQESIKTPALQLVAKMALLHDNKAVTAVPLSGVAPISDERVYHRKLRQQRQSSRRNSPEHTPVSTDGDSKNVKVDSPPRAARPARPRSIGDNDAADADNTDIRFGWAPIHIILSNQYHKAFKSADKSLALVCTQVNSFVTQLWGPAANRRRNHAFFDGAADAACSFYTALVTKDTYSVCYYMHRWMELSVKGVIRICGGHPSTIHDLSVLWDEMTIGEVKKGSSKAFTDKNQIDLYQNHLSGYRDLRDAFVTPTLNMFTTINAWYSDRYPYVEQPRQRSVAECNRLLTFCTKFITWQVSMMSIWAPVIYQRGVEDLTSEASIDEKKQKELQSPDHCRTCICFNNDRHCKTCKCTPAGFLPRHPLPQLKWPPPSSAAAAAQ